jgi:predicted DsbA family dithiol-disulfide isomerase
VDVYADITCPFAHLSLRRLVREREQRGSDLVLRVRAWPLEVVNGVVQDGRMVARTAEQLRATIAPDLFARVDPRRWPSTTLPALGLADAAYEHGPAVGEAVNLALRDALFEHGLPVDDPAVLDRIAADHGVTRPDDVAARVEHDWARGSALGVEGSPTYVLGAHRWFCPALLVRHDDHGLVVTPDEATMREFLDAAFGVPV